MKPDYDLQEHLPRAVDEATRDNAHCSVVKNACFPRMAITHTEAKPSISTSAFGFGKATTATHDRAGAQSPNHSP